MKHLMTTALSHAAIARAAFDDMGTRGDMTAVLGTKQITKAAFDDMGTRGCSVLGAKQITKAAFDDMGVRGSVRPKATGTAKATSTPRAHSGAASVLNMSRTTGLTLGQKGAVFAPMKADGMGGGFMEIDAGTTGRESEDFAAISGAAGRDLDQGHLVA